MKVLSLIHLINNFNQFECGRHHAVTHEFRFLMCFFMLMIYGRLAIRSVHLLRRNQTTIAEHITVINEEFALFYCLINN